MLQLTFECPCCELIESKNDGPESVPPDPARHARIDHRTVFPVHGSPVAVLRDDSEASSQHLPAGVRIDVGSFHAHPKANTVGFVPAPAASACHCALLAPQHAGTNVVVINSVQTGACSALPSVSIASKPALRGRRSSSTGKR